MFISKAALVKFFCIAHGHELNCIYRRERVTASGGEVGRLSIVGGAEVSILCCNYTFSILKWKIGR